MVHFGEICERFREGFGALIQEVIQGQAFLVDLLFKEGVHHDRANPRIRQSFRLFHFFCERARGSHQGIAQV